MNTFLIILAVILALIGIAGSIVPGLPGPPLSWAAVLVLSFTTAADYSAMFLFKQSGDMGLQHRLGNFNNRASLRPAGTAGRYPVAFYRGICGRAD